MAAVVTDSFAGDNNDYKKLFGDAAQGYEALMSFQSFTSEYTGTVHSATFQMRKSGSPTGTVYCHVYNHSGTYGTSSVPSEAVGSPIATASRDVSELSSLTAAFTFTFDDTALLTAGGQYVTGVYYDDGDTSNYIRVYFDSSSPSHGGNAGYYRTGYVAESERDVNFSVSVTRAANVYAKSDAYTQNSTIYNNNIIQVTGLSPILRSYILFDLTPYSDIADAALNLYPVLLTNGCLPYLNEAASEIDPETASAADVWAAAVGTNIGQVTYASGAYSATDVSAYVAEEAGGYCGFGLVNGGDGAIYGASFRSSEYADENQRPYLAITYDSASAPTAPTDVVAVVTNERDVRITWTGSACHGHRFKVAYDGGDWEDAVTIADGGAANTATFTPEEGWTSLKVAVQSFWYGDLDSAYVESTTITEASFVTVSISATSDAWAQGLNVTNDGWLRTQWYGGTHRRSYISFDLSSYSSITDAALSLYFTTIEAYGRPYLRKAVLELDPESASGSEIYEAAGGDVIGQYANTTGAYQSVSAASYVASKAGGSCGFGLTAYQDAWYSSSLFASSENATENRRPYLTITYIDSETNSDNILGSSTLVATSSDTISGTSTLQVTQMDSIGGDTTLIGVLAASISGSSTLFTRRGLFESRDRESASWSERDRSEGVWEFRDTQESRWISVDGKE